MKIYTSSISSLLLKYIPVIALVLTISLPYTAHAQGDGARFY
jgi:hypothetical protein